MNSKEWADDVIANLKRVEQAAKAISPAAAGANNGGPAGAQNNSTLSPDAVLQALATGCRSNSAVVQAIAIRLTQISQKYPQKAA